MKTNLFKRWIRILMVLLPLVCFFGNSHLNAQGSLNVKEQKELIIDSTSLDTEISDDSFFDKLKPINDFFDENPIVLLLTILFGGIMSLLKGYDLLKKLFPKWFKKRLKPFKSKDNKYFKIIIVPSRNHAKTEELLEILMFRFKQMNRDEGFNVIVKKSHGKTIGSYRDGETLGKKYRADMVIWVDYFQDEKEAHIAYNLIPGKRKKISFLDTKGEVKGVESLARIKEGELLGDIDDIMYTVLGLQSYSDGNYSKSLELLNQVKQKTRKTFKYLGDSNYFLKRYDEAREYYKKNLEIRPNSAQYNYDYAISLDECQKFDEAEKYFKKAIEIQPDYGIAYCAYASLFKRNKKFDEAEKYFKKAIELKPEYSIAYNNYGFFLEENGRLEEAEKYYKKGIESGFDDLKLHNNYARLNTRLITEENKKSGNNSIKSTRAFETISLYKKAVRINPNSAITRYNYARFLKSLGFKYSWLQKINNSYAKMQYKKVIKLDPSLQSKERDEFFNL